MGTNRGQLHTKTLRVEFSSENPGKEVTGQRSWGLLLGRCEYFGIRQKWHDTGNVLDATEPHT